jgi:dihydroorotase
VYSNRDKFFTLSYNLPNQKRTNKQSRLFSAIINEKEKYIARFYSTSSSAHNIDSKFNPFFITGLTDAEGALRPVCIVRKSVGHKLGALRAGGSYFSNRTS